MNRRHDESGSMTVWLALASFVMIFLVGLAVDLGGQVHAHERAHDMAAQAARAGGEEVEGAAAIQGRQLTIDPAAARAAAQRYLDVAAVDGTISIHNGNTITVTVHGSAPSLLPGVHLSTSGTAVGARERFTTPGQP